MKKMTLFLLISLFSLSFLNFVKAEDGEDTNSGDLTVQYPEFTDDDSGE